MKRLIIGIFAALAIGLATAPVAGATPIGGGAETGCWGEGLDVCDVKFSVTSVQQNVTCNDASLRPPRADEQWLRFNLEVTADPLFYSSDSPWVFYVKLWSVEDTVNGVTKTKLALSDVCSSGLGHGLMHGDLRPGTHATASIVVIAPKPATYLVLNNGDSQWKWDVR